jgi:hypothetical protein
LRAPGAAHALPGYAEHLAPALSEARRAGTADWYFVTGGDAREHRKVLVTLGYELGVVIYGKRFWYDWSARIAVALRDHMNNQDDSVDLRHLLRTVPVLAVDHVNPTSWKPWFIEALDEVLYARSGRATVLASSKSARDLSELLPLTGPLIEAAIEVRLA